MDMQEKLEQLDHYYEAGQLDEAEKKLDEWLLDASRDENPGARLTLLNELAGLYRTTDRPEKAAETAEEALTLIDALGLSGSSQHATTLLNAATAYARADNASRALELYAAAGEILTENGLAESYPMAALYNNISSVYQASGETEKALEYLQSALEIIVNLPDCEGEAAISRTSIAYALMKLDRYDEAEDFIKEALLYFTTKKGSTDPHFAAVLAASGELSLRRGDYDEAIDSYQKALRETESRYGHNDVCRSLENNIRFAESMREKEGRSPERPEDAG